MSAALPKRSRRAAFTLIEMLLVVGMIAMLTAIVLVAISPARQLAESRNAARQVDVQQVSKAIQQYQVEQEAIPAGLDGTLRMIGSDAAGCKMICIPEDPAEIEFSVRVATGNDDVEEYADGTISLASDLDLIYDGNPGRLNQLIGIRFQSVTVPQDSTITEAFLTFAADGAGGAATLQFFGEDAGDAVPFTVNAGDVSSRNRTNAMVQFTPASDWLSYTPPPPPYETDDSPNLAAIVQEIVDRPDWLSGNNMAFIIDGTDLSYRVALSYEGSAANATLLTIRYQDGADTTASACLDLTGVLAPEFLAQIPQDPLDGTAGKTYYAVQRLGENRVRVRSCRAELNADIYVDQ